MGLYRWVRRTKRTALLALAVLLLLLSSWAVGNIVSVIPTTGEKISRGGIEEEEDRFSYIGIDEKGGSYLWDLILALAIGLIFGSILSLLAVRREEILTQIVTFVSFALIIIFLSSIRLGSIDTGNASPSPIDWEGLPTPQSGLSISIGAYGGTILLIILTITVFIFWMNIKSVSRGEVEGVDREEDSTQRYDDEGELEEEISSAIDEAVEKLNRGYDGRDAIISSYEQMCSLLEDQGVGNSNFLTPREFKEKALDQLDIDSGPMEDLTDMFEEARYSSHSLTDDQREAAIEDLKRLNQELG